MRLQSRKNRFIKKYLSVLISAALSFFFVFLTVYSATTISNNIQTDGTLSVTGASTLTGAVSVAGALKASSTLESSGAARFYDPVTFVTGIGASSTLTVAGGFIAQAASSSVVGGLQVVGTVKASSTFQSTGAAWFYDPVHFETGIAASSTAIFAGRLNASSTFQSTGAAIFYDPVSFRTGIGASSTLSVTGSTTVTGAVNVSGLGTLGTTSVSAAASSTPAQELSVQGDVFIGGVTTGTTTLVIDSPGSTIGSCIQMRGADQASASGGGIFRIYITGGGTSTLTGGLVIERGTCK